MNDIVGFAHIKKEAPSCKGAENPSEFLGQTCAVMEFGVDDCVLVLNPQSTALAMIDKEDVARSFKCGYVNGVVTPPDLNLIEQMAYVMKAQTRKGGYNYIVREMVIATSLHENKFNDSLLWALQ
jgi:hypothetical protein